MRSIVYIIYAVTLEPTAGDVHRFGLPYMPACSGAYQPSPVRDQWRESVAARVYLEKLQRSYVWYGRDMSDIIEDQRWRELCWFFADDLADANRPVSIRLHAAQQLKVLLGPLDYMNGRLPSPAGDW